MRRRIGALLCLSLAFQSLYADDISNLTELQTLRQQGFISEEEYKILKDEVVKDSVNKTELFDLNINSKLVSKSYRVITNKGKIYFPLKQFLKFINFENYEIKNDKLIVYLGSSLRKEIIEIKKSGFVLDDDVYIESEEFKKVFLSGLEINKSRLKIYTYLSFDTPKEIMQLVDINKEKILNKENEQEVIFTSKKKMFDLGYSRVQLGQNFDKSSGEKSYKRKWDGNISYQGGLLYGEVTADYDLKEKELNTVKLEYDNIWKKHNLDFENRRYKKSREWGVSFYKDRSFYEDSGGEIVINERVPVGSRAELIYMGTPIEIQDDKNGVVEFSNPLIRTDRTYTLRVYEPNGKIIEKEIKTVKDYFLQRKGEIEYRVSINERKQYNSFDTEAMFYYGFSNTLTFGLGYGKKNEEVYSSNNEYKKNHIDSIIGNIVYGRTYNGLSYTFSLLGEKTLDNSKIGINRDGEDKIYSLNDRYKYKYLNQLNYKDAKLIYEVETFGEYYEEKNKNRVELEYTLFKHINLGYEWENFKYRSLKPMEKRRVFTASSDYSWNNFLFSFGTSQDVHKSKNNEYRTSIYYNGWHSLTTKLENVWTKNGEEYETKLTVYNNNYKGFLDFSSELSYSNKDKEKLTFSVSVKLNDFLTFDNTFTDSGSRNHRIGIDKVIDLKNPAKKIDSMDSSRVKVYTFIDENNNNLWDKGEEKVPGVEVTIGREKIITDKNGEGMFYGIGNGSIYELKTTIKKPSFTLGNNKLKVRSNFSSTVEAHIPIKPMLTLSGNVNLDNDLELNIEEKENFYNNLLIEVKDLEGKVIESTLPDNEGLFDISGLFPENYYIEVTYLGSEFNLKTIKERIELKYSSKDSTNKMTLNISPNKIAIQKQDNKLAKI